MTDNEADAESGRLTRKYDSINRSMACRPHWLGEHAALLRAAVEAANLASQGQYGKLKPAIEPIDWPTFCQTAEDLSALAKERGHVEDLLRQAGLERLILPDWRK